MTVSYNDFFTFASKLAESTDEMSWRMSAGRAYYAVFHRAKLSAVVCPQNEHLRYASHEALADRFIRHNTNPAKSIAYMLKAMKKIRGIADYEIDDPFAKSEAMNQLANYEVMITRLDAFDKNNSQLSA